MTELSPEVVQHYAESEALMHKIMPIFIGAHSFPMMVVLSNLIAQWLLNHPEEQHDMLMDALLATVAEGILGAQSHTEH